MIKRKRLDFYTDATTLEWRLGQQNRSIGQVRDEAAKM